MQSIVTGTCTLLLYLVGHLDSLGRVIGSFSASLKASVDCVFSSVVFRYVTA